MDKRPRTPSPAQSLVDSETELDSAGTEIDRALAIVEKIQPVPKKQKAGKSTSVPQPESLPFLDGCLDDDVDQQKYEKHFREKPFCSVVSVNFEAVKNDLELRLNLFETLGHYECLLKIDEEFSPEVVRKFYCNMTKANSNDDPEVIRTRLRGREIVLTSGTINKLLEAPSVSSESLQPMSVAEAQQILLQGDLVLPVERRFQPSKMCDFYRIIHYIFSRSIISKPYSFTHISQEECVLLARIIQGEKLDVGGLIFRVMKAFCSSKWKTGAYMPFPQVVSFILKKFNINHLHGETKKKVEVFEKQHVKKMLIPLPYDHKKGLLTPSAKDKGKRKVGISEPELASEAIPEDAPQTSLPKQSMFADVQPGSLAHQLGIALESIFRKLRGDLAEVTDFQQKILDEQANLRSEIAEIRAEQARARTVQDQSLIAIENMGKMIFDYIYGPTISEEDLGGPSEPQPATVHPPELIPDPESNPDPQPSVPESPVPHSSPPPDNPEPSAEPRKPPIYFSSTGKSSSF